MFNLEKDQKKYLNQAKSFLGNQQKTESLLEKAIIKGQSQKGILGGAWDKLQLLIELVSSYSKGEYKNFSKSTMLILIGAIIYFVSPIDAIPDFILGLGILDDSAVIGFTIKRLSTELDKYEEWKISSNL
ncbi:YkvA family protein [Neobacillus sp. LXY-1]|uniref:YkvA family protein n=1 Tax=Neobacillus sp. LXY-1 TaxID=3379133 RepID=UPI003EE31FD8